MRSDARAERASAIDRADSPGADYVAAVPPTAVDLNLDFSPPAAPMGGTALRGVLWLGGARWAAQLFTWASALVIARLLRPEDYGLVALANAIVGLLEVVTDLGLGSALVQSREL